MPISRIPRPSSNPFDSDEDAEDRQHRKTEAHLDQQYHSHGRPQQKAHDDARSDQRRKNERGGERVVANPSPNLFKPKKEYTQESGRPREESSGSGFRFQDSEFRGEALEYKSMEDLEGYSIQKAKETTSSVESCLRVVGEIKEDATQTLVALHQQGEQIKRTHEVTLDIDQNLSKGEKLLGSLGGMFSRTWKPSKSRPITGPAISEYDSGKRGTNHLEQRTALGINKGKSKDRHGPIDSNGQHSTHEILELERRKQDDGLSEVSDVLEELKGMSLEMGKEISSQMVSLNDLDKDVTTLNERVDGANRRARHLLRK